MIKLQNVRLAFPAIYAAKRNEKFPESKPAYSCDLVMPLDDNDPNFQAFWNEAYALLLAEFGPDLIQGVLQQISGDKRLRCYGNGDEKVLSLIHI